MERGRGAGRGVAGHGRAAAGGAVAGLRRARARAAPPHVLRGGARQAGHRGPHRRRQVHAHAGPLQVRYLCVYTTVYSLNINNLFNCHYAYCIILLIYLKKNSLMLFST